MGDEHSSRLSVYAEKLDADAIQRYTDKVALSGGVDPLILTSCSDEQGIKPHSRLHWYPKVELSDIKEYQLVHATSFVTHEQLKAKKSLEEWVCRGTLAEKLRRLRRCARKEAHMGHMGGTASDMAAQNTRKQCLPGMPCGYAAGEQGCSGVNTTYTYMHTWNSMEQPTPVGEAAFQKAPPRCDGATIENP
ncbi:hypothetical protein HPB52_021797 [Rhipicephalus sanguineus]|uniref:Uncharacterized protein n=1 Tax=Rhipicephalus sanguineus TaxID=34632 RepID=A0A9D4QE82_RHISA|nr:hypothetical protein HPB52_021797 [Rhipicephalus sanguineus]